MKTPHLKEQDVPKGWHLVDAEGKVLGRLAARVARVLMGKHRPLYSPHLDTGEFVVVVNAAKVKLTGEKRVKRVIRYHTQYLSGLREIPVARMLERKPEEVVRLAVRRMLPKNRLGRRMFQKLKVYAGAEHPHAAQGPQPLDLAKV